MDTKKITIAVVDGQGGGIGAAIIKELRQVFGEEIEIWALGSNSTATAAMMKARANRGATGENALEVSLAKADLIMGPVAVGWPQAMMGEISPRIAAAVMGANAPKIFVPLSQEGVSLAGFKSEPLPHLVAEAVRLIAQIAQGRQG